MDTGVEHGRQPDPAGDAGREPQGGYAGSYPSTPRPAPAPVYDDQPTTILDLRRAFAEAGPQDAPPLGVVTVQREHPLRAALAFMAVLALIAGAAGGLVMGIASVGKSLFAKSSAPPTCSATQVASGTALADFLSGVASSASGVTAEVVRAGCRTEGVADPLTGQSAALTVPAGKQTSAVTSVLTKQHDCQFGQASLSGVRVCSVPLGTGLAAVELRPAKNKKSTTFTVTFR
jgi:hypothetical protein